MMKPLLTPIGMVALDGKQVPRVYISIVFSSPNTQKRIEKIGGVQRY